MALAVADLPDRQLDEAELSRRLYRAARRLEGVGHYDAEDLVQDTLLRYLERGSQLQPTHTDAEAQLYGWLKATLYKLWLDARSRPQIELLEDL